MSKRNWQRDWKVANSLPATVGLVYYVTHTQDLLVIAGVDAKNLEERRLVMDWFNEAREGWPVALEERAKLEKQVRKLWQERAELRADIAWLMNEYGESDEPMSQDALELKKRCLVLKERDELRKERDELLQRIREYEEIIRESTEHVQKLMDENEKLKATKELREQGFPVTVQTLRDVTWDDLSRLEIENMRLKDKIRELRTEIQALRKLRREGKQ